MLLEGTINEQRRARDEQRKPDARGARMGLDTSVPTGRGHRDHSRRHCWWVRPIPPTNLAFLMGLSRARQPRPSSKSIFAPHMEIKLFKKEKAVARKISDSYTVFNFLTADDSDKISIAIGSAEDHDETTSTSSDRAYFILEGKITVNDNLVGKPGDVIFIPSNIKYNFKGTFRAVIVNSPPFRKLGEKISKLSKVKK